MNDYVKKYVDQGFCVFPCWQDTKAPVTKNGFWDATNDISALEKYFYNDDFLIGFPTGQKNKIVAIDFDINKKIPNTEIIDNRTVEELIEEVTLNFGALPDTFTVETPSGGRHFYYSIPYGLNVISRARFLDKSLPIDIRGDGGYVCAPDEKNYIVYDDFENIGVENLFEQCTRIPDWIVQYKKTREEVEQNIENVLPESEIKEIRSALSYISSDDRDTWIQIGMALKSTGSPTSYGLWNEWSKTSTKYNPNDMEKRWNGLKPKDITIATLFHEAKKYGWISTYEKGDKTCLMSPANTQIQVPQITPETKIIKYKKEPFPETLLKPSGLVGEIMDYILLKSIMPQPVFALSAALCTVGTLAGRKVQTETGIRSNIYCLNVGKSGCGKEAPQKVIKELMQEAGCGEMASVEDIASDSAIITAMSANPSQVFLLDEIGRFIETTKKGSTHLYNVISVLLKMYSSADQIYYGKIYADKDKKTNIIQPNLCILGSTVPDTLYRGLTYESISDGFLARMLIFETDENRPRKQRNKNFLQKPGKNLLDKIKLLNRKKINVNPTGNLDEVYVPNPQIVRMSDGAKEILDDFDDFIFDLREELEENHKIESIYNRSAQLAEQISLILAVGNNIENPIITESEILYGITLSKYLSEQMQYIAENYMAQNEQEHEAKRILKMIRDNGKMSLSDISKKSQNLKGYERRDILETLVASKQIQKAIDGHGIYQHEVYISI